MTKMRNLGSEGYQTDVVKSQQQTHWGHSSMMAWVVGIKVDVGGKGLAGWGVGAVISVA